MARWMEPTPEQEAGLAEFVASRPPMVRAILERLPFFELYRLKSTGHRVTLYSVSEDGTVTVDILAKFNKILFERQVFGIDPDDLEPCELPEPDEPLGASMRHEEVDQNIDTLRVAVRPDLWELNSEGTAVRRQKSR